MITIAIANQKGGVGKTTIAFNLAYTLATQRQTKILVLDNDPQRNLTSSVLEVPSSLKSDILDAYNGKPLVPEQVSKNLYLVGSNIALAPVSERNFEVIFSLKEALATLRSDADENGFDYVIIDCPPSFGHLQLAALVAADFILIPVKAAPYALIGMQELFRTIEKVRKYFNPGLRIIGIILNQVDGRRPVIEREMEEVLRKSYGRLVFKTRIKKRVKVEESPSFQQAITAYDPKGPSAQEFRALTKEILRRIKRMKEVENRR